MRDQESVIIDGYDVLGESARLDLPDQVVCGRRLNRATAVPAQSTPQDTPEALLTEHDAALIPTTREAGRRAVDLSHPAHGMFVSSDGGVYLDLSLGLGQKIVDESHPHLLGTRRQLDEQGLTFRREVTSSDLIHLGCDGVEGVHTPVQLGSLINELSAEAFPGAGPFKTFFSNSGAEAGEAAIKLAMLNAYRRFVARHGLDVLAALMDDLGIRRDGDDDVQEQLSDPLYEDYPFFVFGTDGAFHGRTLGVLNLSRSRKAEHLGYARLRWVRHVPFNGDVCDLTDRLDDRPVPEILAAPGGVRAVLDAGRVPAELVALFATEVFQAEGGFRMAEASWLQDMAAACRERDILVGVDEVQSFGRTGVLFATQHYAIGPDLLWTAKASVLGVTVARSALAKACHTGWHGEASGGGKLFDTNMAYATFELLARRRDALFGRTLLENSRIKGLYLRMRLAELCSAHGEVFPEFHGLGGMWGLSVMHREDVLATAWRLGLKLVGCGPAGEVSRIRILLLADVLTREIDVMVEALDRVFEAVEEQHDL